MCTAVAKFFKNVGWVVAKNRDQDYVPNVSFIDQNHDKVNEILVMADNNTKYREGMNHKGLGIISTSLAPIPSLEMDARDGRLIDAALKMTDPKKAAEYLVTNKMTGFIFVFNQYSLYLIEAAKTNQGKGEYKSTLREVPISETIVRTNHGVDLPWAGFQPGIDKKQDLKYKSSISRKKIAEKELASASTPFGVLKALGSKATNDLQMNVFRVATKPREMRTIFQNLLVPKEKKMYVVPIQCTMKIRTDRPHVSLDVLNNQYIKKTYDGKIKYFATIKRRGPEVRCVSEETLSFTYFATSLLTRR